MTSSRVSHVEDDPDIVLGPLLKPYSRAVLAVSGGSDSMALMLLVARWIEAGKAPSTLSIEVATVDHKLRPESSSEAEWVAKKAKALGLSHTTLVWSGDKPATGVQEQAREARYALLVAHARQWPPAAVVTGHTADDQAETLLMRLARGSGLDGLSSMVPSRPLLDDGSVHLVRPLLGAAKSDLKAFLKRTQVEWLDDPSNERMDFERVRLRAAHAHQESLGLASDKLALSARRLCRARDALDHYAGMRLGTLVDIHDGAYASIDRPAWEAEPAEIRIRLLQRLLAAFGGDARPAQLSQIEALEAAMSAGGTFAGTLGGCIISQGRRSLRLYREMGAKRLPYAVLLPEQDVVWDGRFRVRYAGKGNGEKQAAVTVRPLGLAAYATLREAVPAHVRPPVRAAAGLPSIWSGESLVAVPALAGGAHGDKRFSAEFIGLRRHT